MTEQDPVVRLVYDGHDDDGVGAWVRGIVQARAVARSIKWREMQQKAETYAVGHGTRFVSSVHGTNDEQATFHPAHAETCGEPHPEQNLGPLSMRILI